MQHIGVSQQVASLRGVCSSCERKSCALFRSCVSREVGIMELKPDAGDICLSAAPGLDESWVFSRHTGERALLPTGGKWHVANEDGWALLVSEHDDVAPIWCSELLRRPLYVSDAGRVAYLDTHSALPEQQETTRFRWLDVELDDWTLMSLTLRVGNCKSSLKFSVEVKALCRVSLLHFHTACKRHCNVADIAHSQGALRACFPLP